MFRLVANALERDQSMREAMAAHDNVRVSEAAHGAGVHKAGAERSDESMSTQRLSVSANSGSDGRHRSALIGDCWPRRRRGSAPRLSGFPH